MIVINLLDVPVVMEPLTVFALGLLGLTAASGSSFESVAAASRLTSPLRSSSAEVVQLAVFLCGIVIEVDVLEDLDDIALCVAHFL